MPQISVIVPVYRVEEYLDRCVQSVLHQSFRDLELILVDDGSPDGCPAMCDEYAREDSRVHVIHQKNGGLSAARNAGLDWLYAHSDSSWLTFLDSDDWLHRDALGRILEAADRTGVRLLFCGDRDVYETVPDAVLPPVSPEVLPVEEAYETCYRQCMSACCQFIYREQMQNLRFPVGKLHEDCFLTHRLVFSVDRVAVLRENLYYYYHSPNSIMRAEWYPRRLEEIEAHEARLQYLRDRGYARAEKVELETLAGTVYEQAEALAQLKKPEYAPFLRDLRRRLRQAMREAKGLIPMNREKIWVYLMAWPTLPVWKLGKKLQQAYHRKKGTE